MRYKYKKIIGSTNTYILLTILIMMASSCKKQAVIDKNKLYLDSLFLVTYNTSIPVNSENIFVINDNNGACGDCVSDYYNYVLSFTKDEKSLIIINSGSEGILNLQKIKSERHRKNIILCEKEIPFNYTNPLSMLLYIRVSEQRIDTIIPITYPANYKIMAIDSIVNKKPLELSINNLLN